MDIVKEIQASDVVRKKVNESTDTLVLSLIDDLRRTADAIDKGVYSLLAVQYHLYSSLDPATADKAFAAIQSQIQHTSKEIAGKLQKEKANSLAKIAKLLDKVILSVMHI